MVQKKFLDKKGLYLMETTNTFKIKNKSQRSKFGAEYMAEKINKSLLINDDVFKNYNLILMPGGQVESFNKKGIAWCHLNSKNDSVIYQFKDHSKDFEEIKFVSEWQANQFVQDLLIENKSHIVLKNAIDPIPLHQKPSKDIINIVYAPDDINLLGLPILLNSLNFIKDKDIRVYIFRDVNLSSIKKDSRIMLKNWIPKESFREKLKEMHMFVYPCMSEDPSCVSLIEAMSAGCYSIHSDSGGLNEISSGFAKTYDIPKDKNAHAQILADKISDGLKEIRNGWNSELQVKTINKEFSWDTRIPQLESFISYLKNKQTKEIKG